MNSDIIMWGVEIVFMILFAISGFVIKGIFSRLDVYGKRINALEIASARNISENATLFKRLDGIEVKLDRLLENWRKQS
tara:strand:- start:1308 stop:1544 length:237 start_codon:yes stop_codon:yes gene_type:complete